MVRILYAKFHKLVASLAPWRRHFRAFAQHLVDWGCPHDNLVAIFDGHFQATCRPGGDANHSLTLHDNQTFSGKERLHGLKYQACVMPNGICCVWGPWRGTEHDATMFANSGVIDDLARISGEEGTDFSGYGDSAYPLHRHMQRILKAPAEGSLTRLQRRYNALMARFRVVIENCFGEAAQYWGMLQHRHNLRLGKQQVGKMFQLAMLLFNLHSLL